MNLLQRWILGKRLADELEQKGVTPYNVGVKYEFRQGRLITPADNKNTYITDGYNKNDIIYSVINLILDKVILPEWALYKVVNESSLKEYHRLMSLKGITAPQYKKAMQLKYEAVEPIESFNLQQGKLKNLLKYPNETDTMQDHTRSLMGYKLLVGDYYEWGEMLKGGANIGIPNELWSLPAHLMNIKITDEFPAKASSYELLVWNQQFTKESVLHEKYWNPNWNINGEQLYGFAPLRAFLKNINRNNSAKDASTAKFQNGGLDTIIYMDDQRMSFEQGLQQASALKQKLAEEYSGPENQGKRAVSGVKTGAVPLGSTPVELGIIDSEKWDAIMFCNGYGVPPEMLGLVAKTYNNVKEAEKALTTRSAIPLLTSRRNSFNRKIQTDWGFKGVNIYVDYDTECFPELQTDIAEWMASTEKMIMITPNEQREGANLEARPEPEADEAWVLNGGRVPLSDYQANEVDNVLNAANVNGQLKPTNGKPVSGNGKPAVPVS
jgi:HK97 family phage portal protein